MSNELATTTVKRLEVLLNTDGYKNEFNSVLKAKAAAFMSSIISAVKMSKGLREVGDPESIIKSAMIAATLDLPINPSLGFTHIVPYKTDGVAVAQFQMGWKGFVQLGMRTGQYRTMNAIEIYDGELIKKNKFTGVYEFDEDKKKSEKIIGYLFYFELTNGYSKQVYWTQEQVEKHAERYSPAYKYDIKNKTKNSFWSKDFTSQALKTVVKNGLSKWGILSTEMQKAILKDGGVAIDVQAEEVTYPDGEERVEPPVKEAETHSSKLSKVIDAVAVPVVHDGSRTAHWKNLFMAAPNVKELNDVLKMIPENEHSPDLSEAYSAQYKVLASLKK